MDQLMNNTVSLSMANLFKQLGYDYQSMAVGAIYDVSSRRAKIRSFNHSSGEIEFKLIEAIIRKPAAPVYAVISDSGMVLFKGSEEHQVFSVDHNVYMSLGSLELLDSVTLKFLDDDKLCRVELLEHEDDILDLTVQGNSNYFTGGILSHNSSSPRAIRFFASIRIKCTFNDWIKGRSGDDGEVIGMLSRLKTVKNKLVAPGRIRVVKILFGKGYQTEEEWIEYATLHGVIEKTSASWYKLPDGTKINGLAALVAAVQADPDLKQRVIALTRVAMSSSVDSPDVIDSVALEEKSNRVGDSESALETEDLVTEVVGIVPCDTAAIQEMIDLALSLSIIQKMPSGWFELPNGRKIWSQPKLLDLVTNDMDLQDLIREELKQPQETIDEELEGLEDIAPIDDSIEVQDSTSDDVNWSSTRDPVEYGK